MKVHSKIRAMFGIVMTFGLSGVAWGACNTTQNPDDSFVTGAASVFELSGQGNLNCQDLNMFSIAADITLSSDGKQVTLWETTEEADAVVVKPSNGNRCIYNYPDIALSGQLLSPGSNKTISNVLVCSDGIAGFAPQEPEPDPVLPTTTAGNLCEGDITIDGTSIFDPNANVVVLAETLDGQTKAACSLSASGQEFCEDRCENFRDVGETPACLSTVNSLGEFNLAACQPCDTTLDVIARGDVPPKDPLTGEPMEFCWEKVNSVYEGADDIAGIPPAIGTTPRSADTMLKHTPIRQSEISITWYNACYKVPIPINGTYYWVTTCR